MGIRKYARSTYEYTRQAVLVILLYEERDGKIQVVIVRSTSLCGLTYRKIVGGGVKEGETVLDAAIRETKEEAGLTIKEENCYQLRSVRKPSQSKDYEYHEQFIIIAELETLTGLRLLSSDGEEKLYTEVVSIEELMSQIRTARQSSNQDEYMLMSHKKILENFIPVLFPIAA